MKAVILAGGLGTRLSEETAVVPKPMVTINDQPILHHIMAIYANVGITEFVICAGFKQHVIKDYFYHFHRNHSDVAFDLATGDVHVLRSQAPDWKVTVVDTGLETMTGGRLGRVKHLLSDGTFCMTYGDGVSDVDIADSIAFHKAHGKLSTVTAVKAPGRFGDLVLDGSHVESFAEKVEGEKHRINGGFFVLEPSTLDLITCDDTIWEQEPMRTLAAQGEMEAYLHEGFWQPMDTLKDRRYLESLCVGEKPPWL